MALSDRPNGPVSQAATVPNQIPMNTQAGQAGPLPATQAIVSTAETLILSPELATVALMCALGPDTTIEQTVFDFFASGIIETTNATNVTIKIYEGAVIAAGNLLGSSGAIAQNGASVAVPNVAAWFAHASLIFDSVSGVLAGTIEFYVNKTIVAKVTLSNFVAGFANTGNPSANPPTYPNLPSFCMSLTSSAATALLPTTINVQKFTVG